MIKNIWLLLISILLATALVLFVESNKNNYNDPLQAGPNNAYHIE